MFRFCVLSAVSKESQATEDKDSLDHQLRSAKSYGESVGGKFIREYRMDGFTRSGYYDFSQARTLWRSSPKSARRTRRGKPN